MNKLIARKGKRAFTLIELIVVVAILGILSLIAIPSFNGFREAANAGVAYTNASELARSASALYELDSNTPDPLAVAASEANVTLVNQAVVINGWCSAINQDADGHYQAVAAVQGACSGHGPVMTCQQVIDAFVTNVMNVYARGFQADGEVYWTYFQNIGPTCWNAETSSYDPAYTAWYPSFTAWN